MTIRSISQEPPPPGLDPEVAEWITRRMTEISIALGQTQDFEPLFIRPEKEFTGID